MWLKIIRKSTFSENDLQDEFSIKFKEEILKFKKETVKNPEEVKKEKSEN